MMMMMTKMMIELDDSTFEQNQPQIIVDADAHTDVDVYVHIDVEALAYQIKLYW